ncbi:MAG: HAD family hydrolase, partial [Turicibacter sp.]
DIIFMNKEAVNILTLANEIKFNLLTEEDKKLTAASQKIIYEENVHHFDKNLDKTNKICLWSEEDVFIKIRDVFLEGKSQLAQSFPFESRYYYEIIQSKCNKGEAILELCHDLHIPIEETMAFGDGLNDIDMLKVVGTAIGIESGNKEIFKYVSSICEEPMKDGIYLELKRRNVI